MKTLKIVLLSVIIALALTWVYYALADKSYPEPHENIAQYQDNISTQIPIVGSIKVKSAQPVCATSDARLKAIEARLTALEQRR